MADRYGTAPTNGEFFQECIRTPRPFVSPQAGQTEVLLEIHPRTTEVAHQPRCLRFQQVAQAAPLRIAFAEMRHVVAVVDRLVDGEACQRALQQSAHGHKLKVGGGGDASFDGYALGLKLTIGSPLANAPPFAEPQDFVRGLRFA